MKEVVDFDEKDLNMLALTSFRCSVIGGYAFVLEGHKGLKSFDAQKIEFRQNKNTLISVVGLNLTIKQLTKSYALILGKITGVNYETVG
jgi:sporulation protein YqfC